MPYEKPRLTTFKDWWHRFASLKNGKTDSHLQPLLGSQDETSVTIDDEDEDVRAERNKILAGSANNAIIYLHNMRKVPLILWLNISLVL